MSKSLLLAVMTAVCFFDPFPARAAVQNVEVGDQVVLKMSGRIAEDYVRITTGKPATGSGLQVQVMATVAQLLGNGQIRLESSNSLRENDQTERMVTITGRCYTKQLVARPIAKGAPVYASPGEAKDPAKAKLTPSDSRMLEVELSGLMDLKIRVWTVAEEISE